MRGRGLKLLTVKVFAPGNRSFRTILLKCPPGKQLRPGGEEYLLGQVIAEVETNFPQHEFALKAVGRGCFNIVWIRQKDVDPEDLVIAGMHLGEITQTTVEGEDASAVLSNGPEV